MWHNLLKYLPFLCPKNEFAGQFGVTLFGSELGNTLSNAGQLGS